MNAEALETVRVLLGCVDVREIWLIFGGWDKMFWMS